MMWLLQLHHAHGPDNSRLDFKIRKRRCSSAQGLGGRFVCVCVCFDVCACVCACARVCVCHPARVYSLAPTSSSHASSSSSPPPGLGFLRAQCNRQRLRVQVPRPLPQAHRFIFATPSISLPFIALWRILALLFLFSRSFLNPFVPRSAEQISAKVREVLRRNIEHKLKLNPVKVRADFDATCFGERGTQRPPTFPPSSARHACSWQQQTRPAPC